MFEQVISYLKNLFSCLLKNLSLQRPPGPEHKTIDYEQTIQPPLTEKIVDNYIELARRDHDPGDSTLTVYTKDGQHIVLTKTNVPDAVFLVLERDYLDYYKIEKS